MDVESLMRRQENQDLHRQALDAELGIFELRNVGRALGVISPTTKKRSELIDLIMDKIYNTDCTKVKVSKKGRPCKSLTNINEILAKVTGSDIIDSLPTQRRPLKYEDVVVFAQDVPVFSEVDDKADLFSGVIRKTDIIAYLIDTKLGTKIFIAKREMDEFRLNAGDYVEIMASKINSQEEYLATNILKVNGEDIALRRNRIIEAGQPIISMEKLVFGEHEVFCGRRNLIQVKSNIFENDNFVKFANACAQNDYDLITLSLNTGFEDRIVFNSISSMLNMTTSYGSGFDEGFNKVIDTIAYAERLLQIGRKCVIFVSDIISLINTLDRCFDESDLLHEHKVKSIVIVQKLISLGKALSNGASVTLIMTYREEDKNDKFIYNELNRVCSKFYE